MEIVSRAGTSSSAGSDSDLQLGEVVTMIAEGKVRLEQGGQIATGERITFFPPEERALLQGAPEVRNLEARVRGDAMELRPGMAVVRSGASDGSAVVVDLPPMPDLGYSGFGSTSIGSAMPDAGVEASPTRIRSKVLRMIESEGGTTFRFSDAVQVEATNLKASCERLDVITETTGAGAEAAASPSRLEVDRIEGFGGVSIEQSGRTAQSEKIIIEPKEGRLVLEENASVTDERGVVAGHRMTLLQGQRRAIVEGGGPQEERARITLPALPGRD
jgi:lipopolysaccharide export system protein LptA